MKARVLGDARRYDDDGCRHRFFEALFAIPAIVAVLPTVNIRLSPEQIALGNYEKWRLSDPLSDDKMLSLAPTHMPRSYFKVWRQMVGNGVSSRVKNGCAILA